eukprot:gnl/MRDRNA2_/MRDRNA2_72331_c0_seq1.p1 gnl/MRDRNA2_/MRDRNA2_72331_c0~~gnl/MRDRNA2_/MRDRNA2_72331_c0_seq1.p1  ORF type:complete len:1019 (+),score=221.89 gnl/MRDRNA2_/MRDRNA2_72331_c0_seq1:70-3126(+)
MQVRVLGSEGIPDGSVLSIRSRDQRKQSTIRGGQHSPLKFDSCLDSAWPIKIDVYEPIGSTGVLKGPLGIGEHNLTIQPPNGSTSPITLRVEISEDGKEATPVSSQLLESRRERVTNNANEYLESHGVNKALQDALSKLLKERPSNPQLFLSRFFSEAEAAMSELSEATKAKKKADCSIALFTVPQVSIEKRVPILDFGSGEIGLYMYEVSPTGQVCATGVKIQFTLFASFVETQKVEEFCSELMQHLKLEADGDEIDIFAGATGIHRDMLQSDVVKRQKIFDFFAKVEASLQACIGCRVNLRLFVPSGLLEAQFELRATNWLVQQSQVEIAGLESACTEKMLLEAFESFRSEAGTCGSTSFPDFCAAVKMSNAPALSAVRRTIFAGTISAGGGSTQLSMLGGSEVSQLFSMPVGNRIPIIEGMFSKPVLPSERSAWAERIQLSLRNAGFPQQLTGLYVGISAMFYAAKAAGINDVVLTKGQVVQAFSKSLDACDEQDQRMIAGLMLAYAVTQFVFDDSACILFKRNWQCGDTKYSATWTFGCFTEQLTEKLSERNFKRQLTPNPFHAAKALVASQRLSACKTASLNSELLSNRPPDDIFEVPFVAWPGHPSVLLDFGSGEIGFYCYWVDIPVGQVATAASSKCGKPLYEYFVANGKVDEFCDEFIQRLDLVLNDEKKQYGDSSDLLLVAGGATGLHREMFLTAPHRRLQTVQFLSDVEGALHVRLQRSFKFQLFIPSGELEAQFELRATAWLVQQARVDVCNAPLGLQEYFLREAFNELAGSDGLLTLSEAESLLLDVGVQKGEIQRAFELADVDLSGSLDFEEFHKRIDESDEVFARVLDNAQFQGTLSAGGGSSQLAMIAAIQAAHSMQLFSASVGNRVPLVEGMFSKFVTEDERVMWVERIHDKFKASSFPKGIHGLFVGISATYHAAKKAGIADRIIGKGEAVMALAKALNELGPNDSRDIANLILVKELLEWAFDEGASFLFKRNWHIGGHQYTASWTLGWYISQFEENLEE